MTEHILALSGGKDSTAMFLEALRRGMPLDKVIFFWEGENWCYPHVRRHIDLLIKKTGYPITIIDGGALMDHEFYDHQYADGRVGRGFPSWSTRWCSGVKENEMSKHITADGVVYLGIAYDEKHRYKRDWYRNKHRRRIRYQLPLVEWEMTQRDCLSLCYHRGYDWDNLYQYHVRGGCFCCPLQSLKALKSIFLYFPDLWEKILKMQMDTYKPFRCYGKDRPDISAVAIDRRLRAEVRINGFMDIPADREYPQGKYSHLWL